MHEIGLGTTGLNPVHGTPRNPHDTSHHTGGSSSGSAAIVAAGLAVFAVGADGGGSIRIPSAICGCVGLKTTHSRVCPHPGPQIAYTVGVVGPIAATVRDCAIMYAMLANRGHEQYKMPVPPPVSLPDLSSAALAGAKPLEGVTVGVHWSWFEHAKKPVVDACRRAVGLLEGLGARVRPVVVPNLRELALAHAATITPEMRCAISAYYNNPTLRRQLNAETRISLATGGSFSTGYYIAAQQIRRRADASTRLVFAECDLLATPTVPMLAPPVLPGSESGASDIRTTVSLMRFAQLGNMLGLPGISLPVGSAPAREGGPELPIGLQLMAAPWQEAVLLRTAALLERVLGPAGKPKPSLHWDPLQA